MHSQWWRWLLGDGYLQVCNAPISDSRVRRWPTYKSRRQLRQPTAGIARLYLRADFCQYGLGDYHVLPITYHGCTPCNYVHLSHRDIFHVRNADYARPLMAEVW